MTLSSGLTLDVEIGHGFFSSVFRARDDVHGDVAVKIPRQYPGEPNADWILRKETLLKEGQHLSQAGHPNVVRVFSVLRDESTDIPWLVMELCRGGLLSAFEAGPMRLTDVRRVSSQVALGLRSLHAQGKLHRDIKPGNILISKKGIAQLGDFGLVTDDLVVGYGSAAGYSDHLAPEVWNHRRTSEKTDVWALGMTIYRLLHGKEWYSRLPSNPRDIIPSGGFANTLPWLPHIGARWRRAIRHMMRDDPAQRCPSADHVISALAGLDCEPDWKCAVAADSIQWKRKTKQRRIKVVWESSSPRHHEWRAWSEPLGQGNRRALGGSKGALTHKAVERELRAFFAS